MLRSLVAIALTLTQVSPAAARQTKEKGRKVAFVVGVGQFAHDLADLKGSPQRDATEMAAVLRAGGFEVVLMRDAEATRDKILARFKALLDGDGNPDRSLGKHDLLLVHYCSHGFTLAPPGERDSPFLAAHDTKLDHPQTMVPLNALIAESKGSGATVLYLIDACREIVDKDRGEGRPRVQRRGVDGTQVVLPSGTAILFSCRRGQYAHQSTQTDKAGGHGLFSYAVLKTLRSGGRVTWTRLVGGVEEAFDSDEFQAMLPKGRPQVPVEAKGELGTTELLAGRPGGTGKDGGMGGGGTAGGSAPPAPPKEPVKEKEPDRGAAIRDDMKTYLSALARDEVAAHLRRTAPDRMAAWRAAAEKGDATAQFLVARCLMDGLGVEKNEAEAVEWYKKAAAAGQPNAMVNLGVMYRGGRGTREDLEKAVEWYRKAADAGQPIGMHNLAGMYEDGLGGLPKSAEKAVEWFQRAYDAGYATSKTALARNLVLLGDEHDEALGRPENTAKGFEMYRRAAELGNTVGMTSLGFMYEKGRGTDQNYERAVEWYKRAAEAGDRHGMKCLGVMYYNGRGVPKDFDRAFTWFRKGAEAGSVQAMTNLGFLYETGRGTDRDDDKAFDWYTKAAEGGDPRGIALLGSCYEEGRGTKKDRERAIELYRKAAARGDTWAKDALKRLDRD